MFRGLEASNWFDGGISRSGVQGDVILGSVAPLFAEIEKYLAINFQGHRQCWSISQLGQQIASPKSKFRTEFITKFD